MELVRQLRDAHDLTVVLVEHHMGLVMRLCDHITVLNFGRTIADGPPAEVGSTRPSSRPTWELRDAAPSSSSTTLSGGYGLVQVLHGVNLQVAEGQVVTVLGANGAGKTTLLRAISGALGRVKGSITFDGVELVGTSTEKIARLGVCQVPEGRGTFIELTVAREPRDRRVAAARTGRHQGRQGTDVRAVPDPRRSAATSGPASCPAVSSRCSASPAP